jgi:hypothetical protein
MPPLAFVGARTPHAYHLLALHQVDPVRLCVLIPDLPGAERWRWGDASLESLGTASAMLHEAIGNHPLLLDLAGVFMEEVLAAKGDYWIMSVTDVIDWANEAEIFTLAHHIDHFGEDA